MAAADIVTSMHQTIPVAGMGKDSAGAEIDPATSPSIQCAPGKVADNNDTLSALQFRSALNQVAQLYNH